MPLFRPGKPKLLARLSAHSACGAAFTPCPFDVYEEEGDFGSHVTGGITIARDGLYLVEHRHHRDGGTGSATAYGAVIVNGVWVAGDQSASSSADLLCSALFVDDLVNGDTVVGASVIAQTGGKGFGTRSVLTVVRIGPKRWT